MPGSDQAIVREVAETDLPAVLELWAVARSYPARTDTGEALERLLARSPGSLLIAQLEGRIVGALIAAWDGWRGNLYRLAVLPGGRASRFCSSARESAGWRPAGRDGSALSLDATTDRRRSCGKPPVISGTSESADL